MEPISILLLAAVITKMVATHREDVQYARKGIESPRHKLKLAKFHAAQKAGRGGKAPARLGAKGYFRELWLDAWDDLHDYRVKTREANKANPRMTLREQLAGIRDWTKHTLNRRKDGKPIDDMVDVAGVRPVSPAPAGDLPAVDGPGRPVGVLDEEDTPTSVVHDDEHPYCVTSCGPKCTARTISYANAGKWAWSCRRPDCGGKAFDYDTEALAQAEAAAHRCADGGTRREGVQILGGVKPAPIGEQPKLATVIPMFPNLKEILMSETNTEVIGLEQSIGYSKALANFAGTHGPAGNEGYIGVLNRAKVTGTGLSTAHEMQEAFANAQAAAERHAAELEKQKTVQEAYDQNPDAGDKEYMQQGR